MLVSLQNSDVKILTPNVVVLGDRVFEKQLGHESGGFGNGTIAFIKETPENSLALFSPCEGTTQKSSLAVCSLEEHPYQNLTMLAPLIWNSSFQNSEK